MTCPKCNQEIKRREQTNEAIIKTDNALRVGDSFINPEKKIIFYCGCGELMSGVETKKVKPQKTEFKFVDGVLNQKDHFFELRGARMVDIIPPADSYYDLNKIAHRKWSNMIYNKMRKVYLKQTNNPINRGKKIKVYAEYNAIDNKVKIGYQYEKMEQENRGKIITSKTA